MADNTTLNTGTGGDTVRDLARQSGTVKTQVVQLDLGGVSANAENLITAGQQTMANSVPVALASNQPAVPVSGTVTANAGTGNFAVTQAAASSADGHDSTIGAQADAAAGSDTATASYIALFKRLLQRITTLLGVIPSALVGNRLDVNLGAAPATVTVTGTVTSNAGTGNFPVIGVSGGQPIAVQQDTANLSNGGTPIAPSGAFANIVASQTDSSIVAAVASKKIRVLEVACEAGATATNITFNSKPAGAGTAISMQFQNAANGGFVLPFSPIGWFDTNAGEGLTATTGAGSTTGVQIKYITI